MGRERTACAAPAPDLRAYHYAHVECPESAPGMEPGLAARSPAVRGPASLTQTLPELADRGPNPAAPRLDARAAGQGPVLPSGCRAEHSEGRWAQVLLHVVTMTRPLGGGREGGEEQNWEGGVGSGGLERGRGQDSLIGRVQGPVRRPHDPDLSCMTD